MCATFTFTSMVLQACFRLLYIFLGDEYSQMKLTHNTDIYPRISRYLANMQASQFTWYYFKLGVGIIYTLQFPFLLYFRKNEIILETFI